ncbi:redoxin domain-containing protein [Paraburkholderia aromaticivorans]|uniref:Peroxiredoxin n=1 Tax=Paraburkholderia aromaticivorans TaxID=2026199 RepID=A0A248VU44_9BURK|nr:redoxin domain-containing protein [Paraburkholderia aromaticivorans]ASW02554.1 peroxiredoxin [Paraburkholderia aromaticivorans]
MTDPLSPSAIPILEAGMQAPDFTLQATPDQKISLSELRGAPVVIAFYPADWSPVCGDELGLFNAALAAIHRLGAQLIAISVDSAWSHTAYATERKLHFPLLADFEPKGEVARSYGVYRAKEGVCERALFVLDGDGIVRWAYVSPITVNPGVDGILGALEQLHTATKQDTP